MAPPETARKIMDKPQDPEAAETVQTTSDPAVAPSTNCSLLAWKTYQGRAMLGYSPKMPDVTLFVIEFLALDETRGTLSGAFVPDAAESQYACKRAPIAFLKGMAERLFFEFMEIHTANVEL